MPRLCISVAFSFRSDIFLLLVKFVELPVQQKTALLRHQLVIYDDNAIQQVALKSLILVKLNFGIALRVKLFPSFIN